MPSSLYLETDDFEQKVTGSLISGTENTRPPKGGLSIEPDMASIKWGAFWGTEKNDCFKQLKFNMKLLKEAINAKKFNALNNQKQFKSCESIHAEV